MNLGDFLSPVRESLLSAVDPENEHLLGNRMAIHREVEGIPEVMQCKIALLGVMEDRGTDHSGMANAPDAIREQLYQLYAGSWDLPVCDLGNIYSGEKLEDTVAAIKEVSSELLKKDITLVILGGSQDLTYGNYRAYEKLEQTVNMVSIDSRFDLGPQGLLNHQNFLSHIILTQPYLLFNYSNLGYQTYFTSQEEIELMERMFFDAVRLGELKKDIAEAEPILRDVDIASFDIAAIRRSDAPGNALANPNGFDGEQACALARYCGLSDKLSSFGIYNYLPSKDQEETTAQLIAQMCWYFFEGFSLRKGDYPFARKEDYDKFTVLIQDGEHDLVFYKSPYSGRWWIQIPMSEMLMENHNRHQLIPCSYNDYLEALEDEVPERWWRAVKKSV